MSQSSIETSCHCGAIRLAIDVAPETVTNGNCSICRRYDALWAYYSPTLARIRHLDGAVTKEYLD